MRSRRFHQLFVMGCCLAGAVVLAWADEQNQKGAADKTQAPAESTSDPDADSKTAKLPPPFPPPANLIRLAKDYDIWLDQPRKQLVVDGKVVLRDGLLEMFACPRQTKEHESIVAVNCKAQFVHAGLIALGVEPGQTVRFDPEYKPASGPEIDIWVLWKDERGNQKALAQEWIQHVKSGKPMEYPFVFAGSGFHVDETTGEKFYLADGGDMICVSNFTTAMIDLPVASPQDNSGLVFKAFTERIPPVGTPVRLVLAPKMKDRPAGTTPPKKEAVSPAKSGEPAAEAPAKASPPAKGGAEAKSGSPVKGN